MARDVFFNDVRIRVVDLLVKVNVAVFVINTALQVAVALMDPRSVIIVLTLVPLVVNMLNLLTAVLVGIAKRRKSPLLLVMSLVFPLASAGFGLIALFIFVGVTILTCSPCINSECGINITCALCLCLVTTVGLVVNYAAYTVMEDLIINNPTLTERVFMLNLTRVSGTIDPSEIGGISDPLPFIGEVPAVVVRNEGSHSLGTVFANNSVANEGFTFVKLDAAQQ